MRTRFTAAPGDDLRAISLPGSFIRGVEIDNPSGSWLYVPAFETFIAPYTLGWSTSLPHDASSIDILAQDGPAGQISTAQGSPIVVYLTDTSIGSNSGSPDPGAGFIAGFTPTLVASITQQVPTFAGLATTIVPGVAGRRIRVLSLTASVFISSIGLGVGDSSIGFAVQDTFATVTIVVGAVHRLSPYISNYPGGIDLPIDAGIDLSASVAFAAEVLNLSITYQVI